MPILYNINKCHFSDYVYQSTPQGCEQYMHTNYFQALDTVFISVIFLKTKKLLWIKKQKSLKQGGDASTGIGLNTRTHG